MPCACFSLTGRPPHPCRIAHSRIERCSRTTCHTQLPAGLPRRAASQTTEADAQGQETVLPTGARRQIDVCEIAPAVYQYTAIDDCSRSRVHGVYSHRTAANTLDFLDQLIEEMPLPIQRIQSDRGLEFFAEKVRKRFIDWAIKFLTIKPCSPHLNGTVEPSQRADLEEFWPTVDPHSADVGERLAEWQHFWNWERLHSGLGGKTAIDRICELLAEIPSQDAVDAAYDPNQRTHPLRQLCRRLIPRAGEMIRADPAHQADVIAANTCGRRLKTLHGHAPYEYICKVWTSEPERFTLTPIHHMPGLNVLQIDSRSVVIRAIRFSQPISSRVSALSAACFGAASAAAIASEKASTPSATLIRPPNASRFDTGVVTTGTPAPR
ncbi:MAG: transposase [Defluviicoccus sp.]|nr:MAG: transposase [Defluviicoccus sp.]